MRLAFNTNNKLARLVDINAKTKSNQLIARYSRTWSTLTEPPRLSKVPTTCVKEKPAPRIPIPTMAEKNLSNHATHFLPSVGVCEEQEAQWQLPGMVEDIRRMHTMDSSRSRAIVLMSTINDWQLGNMKNATEISPLSPYFLVELCHSQSIDWSYRSHANTKLTDNREVGHVASPPW